MLCITGGVSTVCNYLLVFKKTRGKEFEGSPHIQMIIEGMDMLINGFDHYTLYNLYNTLYYT
jgi:hypothetical protein